MKFRITEVKEIEIETSFPIYRKGSTCDLHYYKVIDDNTKIIVACSIRPEAKGHEIAGITLSKNIDSAFYTDTCESTESEFLSKCDEVFNYLAKLANGN